MSKSARRARIEDEAGCLGLVIFWLAFWALFTGVLWIGFGEPIYHYFIEPVIHFLKIGGSR